LNKLDVLGFAPGELYETKYQAFRAAANDVKIATQRTVERGLAELKAPMALTDQEIHTQIDADPEATKFVKTGDFSVFAATMMMAQGKARMLRLWVAGIEHGTVVYCDGKTKKFSYTELVLGGLPTLNEIDEVVKIEDLGNLNFGHVSMADLVIGSEEIESEGGVRLAFVHSHGMKVGGRLGNGPEIDLNKPNQQDLSDPDKNMAERTGIVVCAISSTGQVYCTGGQP
jgi:hypothetical protein